MSAIVSHTTNNNCALDSTNDFITEYDLSYATAKVELDDSSIYRDHPLQQQQQALTGFSYIPVSQRMMQSTTTEYSQQPHGLSNDSHTNAIVMKISEATNTDHRQQQQHQSSVYSSSDIMDSCTISAQQTRPMLTASNSPSAMPADKSMIAKSATLVTTSPLVCTLSSSPTISPSAELSSLNLIFSGSSCTYSSNAFSSPLSPPSNMSVDTRNSFSNTDNGGVLFDYSSPEYAYHHHYDPSQLQHHQQSTVPCSTVSSPNFMHPYRPRNITTRLPIMTNSVSAPTTMMSTNNEESSPLLPHSVTYQPPSRSNLYSSPSPEDYVSRYNDTSPSDLSPNQSSVASASNNELRRQIHIQSEQKRRAQIKDGFEDLRNELPSCLNKKMSKVALLHRTVQHIQHLKSTQITILGELERLMNENDHLRKFQDNVIQKEMSDEPYQVNPMLTPK